LAVDDPNRFQYIVGPRRARVYAIPLFVPTEPIGELPSYHVRVIFLDVVIAWPHVVCLYVLEIFGEIGRDFRAAECPWLGIKHQLRDARFVQPCTIAFDDRQYVGGFARDWYFARPNKGWRGVVSRIIRLVLHRR